jgi:uncharacterized protein (TIGR00288 family)
MHKQKWLTVGMSAAIAGTISSVVLLSNKPIAILAASTAGAFTGLLLSNSQTSQSFQVERLKLTHQELAQMLGKLEKILDRNDIELTELKEQIAHNSNAKPILNPVTTRLDYLERSRELEALLKANNAEILNLNKQLSQIKTIHKESQNVAILYDLENLLKGYNFSNKMLAKLSLKKILQTIQETGQFETIAIQQAYANWSDARLKAMRREINELGIEPKQIFGFSSEAIKNAADIQLAIDAIDLAYLRSSIDVFIIVSGDGGFAALAKKLHEYGKTVIGCAYQNSASKTFRSVCDTFILIEDPDARESQQQTDELPPLKSKSNGLDPRNSRLIKKIKPIPPEELSSVNPDTIFEKTQAILNWYANDRVCHDQLAQSGIYLSVIKQGITAIIPNLKTIQFGFAKFVEYMQYACRDSELCLAHLPPSHVIMFYRDAVPDEATLLPDLEARDVHSVETYQAILAAGAPIYRLPSLPELHAIAAWSIEHPISQCNLEQTIEKIVTGLNQTIPEEVVKNTVLSFISAEIFIREPEGVSLSEQNFSLGDKFNTVKLLMTVLKDAVQEKLLDSLSSVDADVLNQILPESSD